MSNERTTAGKTASGRACARRDWGENGITEERTQAAKNKLLKSAEILETNAARYLESEAARAVIRKADGKKVTRRLYDALALAWGVEKIESQWGGHYWDGLSWKNDQTWERAAEIEIDTEAGWRQRVLVKGESGECDAAATLAEWDKEAASWRKWARGERAAAGCVEFAAAGYNEIAKQARALLDEIARRLDGEVTGSPEITVLCSFSGDVYDRINPFRWHEQNKIELPIEGRAE